MLDSEAGFKPSMQGIVNLDAPGLAIVSLTQK